MNTFNLTLLFDRRAVATIVCHCEEGLDTESITDAATISMGELTGEKRSAWEYAQRIRDKIHSDCNCQAVIVMADAIIPLTGNNTN